MAQELVAGLESPRSADLRVRCHDRRSRLNRNNPQEQTRSKPIIKGEKMENTAKFSINFETIAWGALFILWGIMEMIPSLPDGTGATGIGLILISLYAARSWTGQTTSSFTITFGFLAFLLGALQLAEHYLHLSFDLPIFAILLLALGMIMLVRELKK
jgi:hypothetical protein